MSWSGEVKADYNMYSIYKQPTHLPQHAAHWEPEPSD